MNNQDQAIKSLFDSENKGSDNDIENKPLGDTAQLHVDFIKEQNAQTAIDVGSGAGRILLGLLDAGVKSVVGVDLSSNANNIAEKRLKKEGYDDNIELITGSFLNHEFSNTDAISFHFVMCCHPDRKGMIDKATSLDPKVVVNSIPRDWFFVRFAFGIWGLFSRIRNGFRPYAHSLKSIDLQFKEKRYKVQSREMKFLKVTTSYIKE